MGEGLPQSQAAKEQGHNGGKDQFGRTVLNPAGIDLGLVPEVLEGDGHPPGSESPLGIPLDHEPLRLHHLGARPPIIPPPLIGRHEAVWVQTSYEGRLTEAGVSPEQVDYVFMGQVLQAGQGQIPSRQAQIKGGIPKEVSSETINKVCASGIRAAGLIDQAVRAGDLDVAVGGGMESMSQAPYLLPQARFGFRMGDVQALDAMIQDGLRNPFTFAFHRTRAAFERDRARDANLLRHGYKVLRFTDRQLRRQPVTVVQTLRALISRSSGGGCLNSG